VAAQKQSNLIRRKNLTSWGLPPDRATGGRGWQINPQYFWDAAQTGDQVFL
jgi:hypothetical protein